MAVLGQLDEGLMEEENRKDQIRPLGKMTKLNGQNWS